ncbi:MAG TPA: OsmC family protein [Bryobacteraceae bacterium]|nr:OsmC family protein [Bryobacteraceae bacterium]
MRFELRQISGSASEVAIRDHQIRIDRPADKGGEDRGPMGGELFLAAIGGCFMSTLLAAIRARDAAISGVRTSVIGTIDGTPARFRAIELLVSAACDGRDLLDSLLTIAERGCIMVNTLRGSLELSVRVGSPD